MTWLKVTICGGEKTLNGWKWSKSGGVATSQNEAQRESQAEKKILWFFFYLVSFLRGASHRDIKQQTRVCLNESEKSHSQRYSTVPARGESGGVKKGEKNPIPWRGHQRHVPACFLKVLLKHVQRPHPPIGKPIPNEVRRLQTGLWLSLDSATARRAQRWGPASISHLAFAHSRNLTQL